MILEAFVAFILIFIATFAIYSIGRRSAPKTVVSENEQAAYACGEKVTFRTIRINVSLYKYIIYFVVFDTTVLVLAFASFAIATINPLLLILYLGIILAAGWALVEGEKEND
jgi:NADH:ubiquinone oxidoreductase subunit 3 (subunit A)